MDDDQKKMDGAQPVDAGAAQPENASTEAAEGMKPEEKKEEGEETPAQA